jgi:hypothetical protein
MLNMARKKVLKCCFAHELCERSLEIMNNLFEAFPLVGMRCTFPIPHHRNILQQLKLNWRVKNVLSQVAAFKDQG